MATLKSVKSIQGKRSYMEDRYAYLHKNFITIAMVCDGHGGFEVAEFTSRELPLRLLNALSGAENSRIITAQKIRDTILDWGEEMKRQKSGTTISGILIKNGIMYVYNLGDSRVSAMLQPETFVYLLDPVFNKKDGSLEGKIIIDYNSMDFFCTKDHDLCLSEVDRIHSAGGFLIDDRLNGILNLSRTIGDGDVGKGLCHVPDVYWINTTCISGPVILYTDGITEVKDLSPKEIYNIATKNGVD